MKPSLLVLTLVGAFGVQAMALPNTPDVIPTEGGPIRITPIFHGSLQIEYKGQVIHIDPFSAGDYAGAKKADYILITHTHPDHLDPKAIATVMGNKFVHVLAPRAATSLLLPLVGPKKGIVLGLRNGSTFENKTGRNGKSQSLLFKLEAVRMYNLERGPKPGEKFHPKGHGNGYILTLGGKRIYIAGDTEATPEMKALKNIDIAFVPMNLPYTMTPQEAATGVKGFKPKVVYPYHYRYPFDKPNNNPQQFAKALEGSGINVKLRGWYAHPAPK